MSSGEIVLATLRDGAGYSFERFVELLRLAPTVGVTPADETTVRRRFTEVARFDAASLAADAALLSGLTSALSGSVGQLAEQRVIVDAGWSSRSTATALSAMASHQSECDADLRVLRSWAAATQTAADGIGTLLRTWFLAIARVGEPLVVGVTLPDLATALADGSVQRSLVAADISSRTKLFDDATAAASRGIAEVLDVLTTVTADLDPVPAPATPAPATSVPSRADSPSPTTPTAVEDRPLTLTHSTETDDGHLALAGDQ